MKMEFIFDKDELTKEGYTEEECLQKIDTAFSKESDSIYQTQNGIFEGEEEDYCNFGIMIVKLTKTDWFLKVIKEWYWHLDDDDVEDCLEEYYDYISSRRE